MFSSIPSTLTSYPSQSCRSLLRFPFLEQPRSLRVRLLQSCYQFCFCSSHFRNCFFNKVVLNLVHRALIVDIYSEIYSKHRYLCNYPLDNVLNGSQPTRLDDTRTATPHSLIRYIYPIRLSGSYFAILCS